MHSPCANNATCHNDGLGRYRCDCPAGFTGMNCETGRAIKTICFIHTFKMLDQARRQKFINWQVSTNSRTDRHTDIQSEKSANV